MKLTVQDFRPVAYWLWDVRDADDVCGICQHLFDDVCGGACKAAGDACPLREWGVRGGGG
jgi:anaphase-promoting complex subunit 11